jgi:hypothetical protein
MPTDPMRDYFEILAALGSLRAAVDAVLRPRGRRRPEGGSPYRASSRTRRLPG